MARAAVIILARAGSKGVPGKNKALVGGRPCALWTIDDALASTFARRIVVSTNDADVGALARGVGVEVVDRPAHLATDGATVDDAARHALIALRDESLDPVVILYANVPVRPAGLIDRAVEMLMRTGADSAQSYAPVGKHHPWWTARIDETTGALAPWEGETLNHGVHRRQELPGAYVPDGGVLVVTRDALELRIRGVAPGPHAFFGKDRRAVVNQEGSVIDIDSPRDLLVADAALRERLASGGSREGHSTRLAPPAHARAGKRARA